MKTFGIIGGIAPGSTVEYYRTIIDLYRERTGDGSYPPIVINSIDLTKMLGLIAAGELAAVTEYLLGELGKLARAGADFGLLASNTPHIVFEELQCRPPLPLVSIVEAAREAAEARGLERVGLIGTRFTMQGRFYPKVFARRGIAIVAPDAADQEYIHDKYMGELVHGVFLDETRERLMAIIERLKERAGIEGVILGGTELPLILGDSAHAGFPFLDTTWIHVEQAVARMLS